MAIQPMGLAVHLPAERTRHGENVLVTTATHIHADDVILGQIRRDFGDMGQSVRRLQRGDDPFGFAAQLERIKRFGIGDRDILRATNFMEP